MPALLAGVAVLAVLVFGARAFASTNPHLLAILMRRAAGIVVLLVALFLLARGALPIAIPVGVFGLGLLGIPLGSWFARGGGPFGAGQKSPGGKSSVRTGMMEMVLDHDSGEMEGYCRAGSFEGRTLSSLTETELLMLLDELRGNDPKGALLLEAYLDRSNPGWREAGSGASEGKAARSRYSGRMTREEAYEVLGLRAGAGEDEIRAAHRNLMKKVHPDQGGSDYLAARINEAKDVLLGN